MLALIFFGPLLAASLSSSEFWGKLLRYVPYWLGIIATGILTAQAMRLPWVDVATESGQMIAFVGAMLNAYGIHGVAVWNPPREQWSEQQKIDESRKRVARGEPPLHGFEFVIESMHATPATPPPTPPLPPATPPPLPPAEDPNLKK